MEYASQFEFMHLYLQCHCSIIGSRSVLDARCWLLPQKYRYFNSCSDPNHAPQLLIDFDVQKNGYNYADLLVLSHPILFDRRSIPWRHLGFDNFPHDPIHFIRYEQSEYWFYQNKTHLSLENGIVMVWLSPKNANRNDSLQLSG